MNATEDRLRDALGQHSNDVQVSVSDLADHAIARDQRNRRREVTAIAGAAALALAVALPVALNLGGTPKSAPVPATDGPSITTTVTTPPATALPTITPKPVTSQTTADPGAELLARGWAGGDQLHVGDRTIPLKSGTIVADFAVLDGGGFVLESRMSLGGKVDLEILDKDGFTIKALDFPADGTGAWAVSPEGTRVLVSTGEDLTVYDTSATRLKERQDTRTARAIVGDRAYASAAPLPDNDDQPSLEWDFSTGETRDLPPGVFRVSADGRRATVTRNSDQGYCWALLDLGADTKELARHCDSGFTPTSFSADGSLLLGYSGLEGGYVRALSIRDASTGRRVFGGGEQVDDGLLGWELRLSADGQTVLVSKGTTFDQDSDSWGNTVQQCTLDGQCTTVLPVKRSYHFYQGYYVFAR